MTICGVNVDKVKIFVAKANLQLLPEKQENVTFIYVDWCSFKKVTKRT